MNEEYTDSIVNENGVTLTKRVTEYGTFYYLGNKLHRENGPAAKFRWEAEYWYNNDKPHRLDGPAIIMENGSKYWYQNGLCHRDDGPAVEHCDGTKEWWVSGIKCSETTFVELTKKNIGEATKHTIEGVTYYLNELGLVNNPNGPAVIYERGSKLWYKNGLLHRLDGPAIESKNVMDNQWWIEGKQLSEEEFNQTIK